MNGGVSEFWRNCTKCNTYINTYIPQPHQESVHSDPHLYVGNFGGFGTGKTTTSRQELYKHLFLTPNANTLITANVVPQYEQTIKRELEADLPKAFVKNINVQKQYIDLINGARIMFRPLDDPDKLRSLNLSFFVIIEASETDNESFQLLKTRLRNMSAALPALDEKGNLITKREENGAEVPIYLADWRRGIIESNPGSGWIRNDVLYTSEAVYKHGHILEEYKIPDDIKDKAISSHVCSTDVNAYLPANYIEEISKNKPTWWVNRYVFSSFSYAEGLVYPIAGNCIVPFFQPPKHWKRIICCDYGLTDNFVYDFFAVDENNGIVYQYKEVVTSNRNVDELAKIFFKETEDIPVGGLAMTPIIDPKSGYKRDYNKRTLADYFLDYGISWQPGAVNVEVRVLRTNTYLESGRLKIMDNCSYTIKEFEEYKFPEKKLNASSKAQDKPVDKGNHSINCVEWCCMALPADPKNLQYGAFSTSGADLTRRKEQTAMIPWQLSDIDTNDNRNDFGYGGLGYDDI
jgi:hypothetical protein